MSRGPENAQYEFKTVQALRGRESGTAAKWRKLGYEVVAENRGALRTELTLRRVKPKAPRTALMALAAVFVVGAVLAVAATALGGGDTAEPASAAPQAGAPADSQVLTAGSNEDLATLLALPDYCHETAASFARTYAGRTIEFDGSIANLANHGDYDTRYDLLLAPGDAGPNSTVGPAFKFDDVGIAELNLTPAGSVSAVAEGDRYRFLARVAEYRPESCHFLLEPVATHVR